VTKAGGKKRGALSVCVDVCPAARFSLLRTGSAERYRLARS